MPAAQRHLTCRPSRLQSIERSGYVGRGHAHARAGPFESEPRPSRSRNHEGVGAGRSRSDRTQVEARSQAEESRGAAAHRRGGDLRDRSRGDLARTARRDPRRSALQQEFYARPRVHGHCRCARAGRRRVQDRPARHGRDSRRLRAVQALPPGHVHVMPQLRPELRRRRQGPSRQRLHHRRRLRRISGQQHQHADRDPRRHVGRGGDAGGDGRHRDVWPHRARRPGRGRERRRDRPGTDRLDGGRGRQGAGRAAGDPRRHARQPLEDGTASSAPIT